MTRTIVVPLKAILVVVNDDVRHLVCGCCAYKKCGYLNLVGQVVRAIDRQQPENSEDYKVVQFDRVARRVRLQTTGSTQGRYRLAIFATPEQLRRFEVAV